MSGKLIGKKDRVNPSSIISEIKEIIKQIEEKFSELSALGEIDEPWDGFQRENANAFLDDFAKRERERKDDLLIWKYYSRTGGIYDMLRNFETAVTKPAVNAFDFDEEEKCYYIFIAINNSLLSRLNEQIRNLQEHLPEPPSCNNVNGDTSTEASELLSSYNSVGQSLERIKSQKEWKRKFNEYKDEYRRLTKTPHRSIKAKGQSSKQIQFRIDAAITKLSNALDSNGGNGSFYGRGSSQEKREEALLMKASQLLETMRREIEKYERDLEKYNRKRSLFERNYAALYSYTAKYESLYEAIKALYSMTAEGGELHGLTCSPSIEEGVEAYMKLAEAYCEKSAEITKEYPL